MGHLRPFIRYYGGKARAASYYPSPDHGTIVEPFAGAAGYSLRYPDRRVILVEKYPVVAGIWRYLISVDESEILRIPDVDEHIDELPAWVPQEARWLVGFWLNDGVSSPANRLSSRTRSHRASGWVSGWGGKTKARIASQLHAIRHWEIVEGDYSDAPDIDATWFIDPPYACKGYHYVHGSRSIDYDALGAWCRERRGQIMVCENEGADWLPFRSFRSILSSGNAGSTHSHEVIWP